MINLSFNRKIASKSWLSIELISLSQFKVFNKKKSIPFAHILIKYNLHILFSAATNQYYDSRTLRKICGILGIIKLISGHYLVVATHREFVGVINNQVVWRLAGHDLLPFIPSLIHMSDTQVRVIMKNAHK